MYNIQQIVNSITEVTAKKTNTKTIVRGLLKYYKDTNSYVIFDPETNIETVIDITTIHPLVEYHRKPTQGEIKFGYGATHYKDFEATIYLKRNGVSKQYLKCPIDGLFYSVSRY